MGLLAVVGVGAPAAMAEEPAAPTGAAPQSSTAPETSAAPSAGSTSSTEVLTPVPTTTALTNAPTTAPTTTQAPVAAAAPVGAHYGTGKLAIELRGPNGLVPAGQSINPTGAQVQLSFSEVAGQQSNLTTTCTFGDLGFPFGSTCAFPPTSGLTSNFPGSVMLPDHSSFTLTLTKQPDSGQLLLLPGSPVTAQGHTTDLSDPEQPGSLVTLTAPSGYRTLGVTVQGAGDRSGSTFELCTVPGDDCDPATAPPTPPGIPPFGIPLVPAGIGAASSSGMDPAQVVSATTDAQGRATFPRVHRPGSYRVVQTAAPAGQTFDAAPRTLVVGTATSLADRDAPVQLSLGTPVSTPVTPPGTPAPQAPAPKPAAGTAPAPAGTVAAPSIAPGEQQTVTLSGFQPGELVRGVLRSTPVDLGTVVADANGVATFTFTVPAGVEAGTHTVTMTGLTSGVEQKAAFTVTSPAAATGGLAYTGAEVVPLLAVGGGLLAAGAAAVAVAGRRRSA